MRLLGAVTPPEQVALGHRRRVAAAERVLGLGYWAGSVVGALVGWWALTPPTRPDQGPAAGSAGLGSRLLRRPLAAGAGR